MFSSGATSTALLAADVLDDCRPSVSVRRGARSGMIGMQLQLQISIMLASAQALLPHQRSVVRASEREGRLLGTANRDSGTVWPVYTAQLPPRRGTSARRRRVCQGRRPLGAGIASRAAPGSWKKSCVTSTPPSTTSCLHVGTPSLCRYASNASRSSACTASTSDAHPRTLSCAMRAVCTQIADTVARQARSALRVRGRCRRWVCATCVSKRLSQNRSCTRPSRKHPGRGGAWGAPQRRRGCPGG